MGKTIPMGIVTAIAMLMAASPTVGSLDIPSAYADANCDKAGGEINNGGNPTGNKKQCSQPDAEGPKEPIRNCDSPNRFKDNDGDGNKFCQLRGSN